MASRGPYLILEADGVALRGTVASRGADGGVVVEARERSVAVDPADAVREVLDRLAAVTPVPRRCVLLTADVTLALLTLPLPVGRARPFEQMRHLVRWELEPYFARHAGERSIGSILRAQGVLDAEATAEVVQALAARRQEQGGREGRTARFGDVAVELGHATPERVADALQVHARLMELPESSAYACGWRCVGPADEAGRSVWWAAGMTEERRATWTARLKAHGIQVVAFLPLLGVAAAADGILPPDAALLEVADDRVARVALRSAVPKAFDELPVGDDQTLAGVCRDLANGAPDTAVVLSGPAATDELARAVRPDAALLRHAGLAGALALAAGRPADKAPATIPARDPRPPLSRRPGFRWAAAFALLALLVGGAEFALERALTRTQDEIARTRDEAERVDVAVQAERTRAEEIEGLQDQLGQLRQEQEALRAQLGRFATQLPDRRAFLPGLLQALVKAISEDVVLRRLAEVRPGEVRLEGWGLSEPAIQAFTLAFAERVRPMSLRVHGHEIRAASGPLGQEGFAFAFELLPSLEEARE